MFGGIGPQPPVDKNRVEDLGKQVSHDPGRWSKDMVKLLVIIAVVMGGLVVWALLGG